MVAPVAGAGRCISASPTHASAGCLFPVALDGGCLADLEARVLEIAWLLGQKPWVVPIPGTRRLERLEENLGALALELTADDLRDIGTATSRIEVHGARGTGQEEYL